MTIKTAEESATREVVRWRREQLARAGFPRQLASWLADQPDYDLHALIELVERRCPPEVAIRIVAPLDRSAP